MSSKALNHSLSHEVGVPVFPGFGCRPSGAGVKLCTVYDTQSSGSATYAVQMRGRRCWFASKVSGAEEGRPLPHFASGCVGLFDRLGLLD